MKVLIDTNIYSYAMRNEHGCDQLLRSAETIHINPIVIGELFFGFRSGDKEQRNRKQLNEFLESPRVSILPLTEHTSDFFALIATQLKNDGNPIPSNDVWIAASAMEHGLMLATKDDHFQNIKNLLLWS